MMQGRGEAKECTQRKSTAQESAVFTFKRAESSMLGQALSSCLRERGGGELRAETCLLFLEETSQRVGSHSLRPPSPHEN